MVRGADGAKKLSISNANDSLIAVRLNEWHHYVFVKNGTSLTTYVDGVVIHNNISVPASLNTGFGSIIGVKDTQNVYYVYGQIDQIRIYGRALSVAEVNTIYQSGD